ncbi:MAG TPA: site-specific DNA-methyltransferase [Deltaproteobacteria bacterium]|nr:site-specific DNA-methyltransferase [Deltaproteobacteria bacterium]
MPTLHWIGKDKVVKHHHEVPFKTLRREYVHNAPEGTPENSTGNRIIHGDNLEALKALLPEFEGRVKCIYIDPPYNTGNEGWVYNDNVNDPRIQKWLHQVVGKEGEDLSRHDKWLCMMYPRLKLLHRLLAADGVLLVSIDDVEVNNIRLVLDEIFGRFRFVSQLVWKARQHLDSRSVTGVSNDHEYVLVYSKTQGRIFAGKSRDESKYSNPDEDPRGPWMSRSMLGLATKAQRPNLHYELIDPKTNISYPCAPETGWRYSTDTMGTKISEGRIIFPKRPTGRPREKVFLAELQMSAAGYPSTIDGIYTADGTAEIRAIFGSQLFDFPKPSDLIAELVSQVTDKDSIVLDSFAGSGTTAHAVLKLNAQDSGNRRFILTEMMDYAETITAERVRRVMNGYGEDKKAVAGLGGSFEYYTIGEALFDEDGNLNEAVPLEEIRRYVAYTEGVEYGLSGMSPYYIGHANDAAYLFHYEPDRATALDYEFLNSLRFTESARPTTLVVYADNCLLSQDQLRKHGIIFKKIPRDITRF